MEYIEREVLLQALEEFGGCDAPPDSWADGWDRGILSAIRLVKDQSVADVVEVRHGEWIEDGYYDISCVCLCCGAEAQYTSTFEETFDYDWEENLCSTGYEETREYIRTPFCSNCGARMDGATDTNVGGKLKEGAEE